MKKIRPELSKDPESEFAIRYGAQFISTDMHGAWLDVRFYRAFIIRILVPSATVRSLVLSATVPTLLLSAPGL